MKHHDHVTRCKSMLYMPELNCTRFDGGDWWCFGYCKNPENRSKTGQKRFRIFLLTFLNSLGQDGSNGIPFYAVRSILTLNLDLDLNLRPRKLNFFFLQKNHFEVIKCHAANLKCPQTIVSN